MYEIHEHKAAPIPPMYGTIKYVDTAFIMAIIRYTIALN